MLITLALRICTDITRRHLTDSRDRLNVIDAAFSVHIIDRCYVNVVFYKKNLVYIPLLR